MEKNETPEILSAYDIHGNLHLKIMKEFDADLKNYIKQEVEKARREAKIELLEKLLSMGGWMTNGEYTFERKDILEKIQEKLTELK